MLKTVRVEDAIGMILAHDITEIRPGEFKGAAFRKGDIIHQKDLGHLKRLGKNHLYILDLDPDQVHENEAAIELAMALSGKGICFNKNPKEGKISLTAEHDGLFKVNVDTLIELNLISDVMCTSIHSNTPVKKNKRLAGLRAIPLIIKRDMLNKAIEICSTDSFLFEVKPFQHVNTRIIITGSEVYEGLIEDKFKNIISEKLKNYGLNANQTVFLPDDEDRIAETVEEAINDGIELIITTGGMSVDPDDVTRMGIRKAGVDQLYYGSSALPGAMLLLAYRENISIVGIPACGLFHKNTVFDLVLPRLLAGEKPNNFDLAKLAHGGLCQDCEECRFPNCSFGK